MKTPMLLGAAAIGLLLLSNKSSAATRSGAMPSRGVGGYGGYGIGARQPMPSSTLGNRSNYYVAGQGSTPNIWGALGQTIGGMAKTGTFSGIGESVGSWINSGISSAGGTSNYGGGSVVDSIINGLDLPAAPAVSAPVTAGAIADSAGIGLSAADMATTATASTGAAEIGGGWLADVGLADVLGSAGIEDVAGWALF